MEQQRQNSQGDLEKEQNWMHHTSSFRKNTVIKTVLQ
jgi:hypothetical protein